MSIFVVKKIILKKSGEYFRNAFFGHIPL